MTLQLDSLFVSILEHTCLPLIYIPIAHMVRFAATSERMAQM